MARRCGAVGPAAAAAAAAAAACCSAPAPPLITLSLHAAVLVCRSARAFAAREPAAGQGRIPQGPTFSRSSAEQSGGGWRVDSVAWRRDRRAIDPSSQSTVIFAPSLTALASSSLLCSSGDGLRFREGHHERAHVDAVRHAGLPRAGDRRGKGTRQGCRLVDAR